MEEANQHWRRVIIEKPFGHDLDSAKSAEPATAEGREREADLPHRPLPGQRDGPEHSGVSASPTEFSSRSGTAATSITCRFRWPKPWAWSSAAVTTTMPGALRDMVPNHIMQLISLTAMEPPVSFHADAVRDEQAKILHAIQPLSSEEVLSRTVRGQYGEGMIDGQAGSGLSRRRATFPAIPGPKPSSP